MSISKTKDALWTVLVWRRALNCGDLNVVWLCQLFIESDSIMTTITTAPLCGQWPFVIQCGVVLKCLLSFAGACETSVSARSELSLMGGWSRSAVLQLYRALLRAGQHLEYTDRDYYRRAVTREFRRCQTLSAPAEREDALKRGQFFLNSRLGGLV